MKIERCMILVFFSLNFGFCFAQKKVIDSTVFGNWPTISRSQISNDGNFAVYYIDFVTQRSVWKRNIEMCSVDGRWKKSFNASYVKDSWITTDSKEAIFYTSGDSLSIHTLGKSIVRYITGVKSCDVVDSLIIYQSDYNGIHIVNVNSGQANFFPKVVDYYVNKNRTSLLLKIKNNESIPIQIELMNVSDYSRRLIWQGKSAYNFVFDSKGNQLAFLSSDGGRRLIWYYNKDSARAVTLVDEQSLNLNDKDLILSSIDKFSTTGEGLLFNMKCKDEIRNVDQRSGVNVDVWNYKDSKLQSTQLFESNEDSDYAMVLLIENKKLQRLEKSSLDQVIGYQGNTILLTHKIADGDFSENAWNNVDRLYFEVIDTKASMNRVLPRLDYVRLSPHGKYVIYYDSNSSNYFSYNVKTSKIVNITKNIATSWLTYKNDFPDSCKAVSGITGWIEHDEALLIHDTYDIWLVDPCGDKLPINLTNRYGYLHNIIFYPTFNYTDLSATWKDTLILTAFNVATKENGFFSITISGSKDPKLLTMGNYVYNTPNQNLFNEGEQPIKSRDINVYIVKRMNSSSAPNLYLTRDFIKFMKLSEIHPEKEYNWLTSELVSWRNFDGELMQGVLYKPEDFDIRKKYPLIFYYYQRLSSNLNTYIIPELSNGAINIPYMVSNGYLVFIPDIAFKPGNPGESALNSVLSAVEYLKNRKYIDATRLGIQGHSFGGFETNYILSHTDIFSAACSASGFSNFVSDYNNIVEDGISKQSMFEVGQNRMGSTLWQMPELYIKNSSIFKANQISTPVLLMNNKKDNIVLFRHGEEVFTALRKLGKKVWMLQYDDEGHSVEGRAASLDFTIRMTQFFDYYLKGTRAPKWMTKGGGAVDNDVATGLELDKYGIIP